MIGLKIEFVWPLSAFPFALIGDQDSGMNCRRFHCQCVILSKHLALRSVPCTKNPSKHGLGGLLLLPRAFVATLVSVPKER